MTAPIPFFVGCGRSGTTLVRAIFDSHPAMAVPGESYFPVWLARDNPRYEARGAFDDDLFVEDLLRDEWFRRWSLRDDDVRSAMRRAAPRDFPEAVRAIYQLYADQHGKTRYGDKTPTFVLHIPTLAELLPESVFVQIVRDGRDVALSLLDMEWGPTTMGRAALHWRVHVEKGRRDGGRLGPDRYLEVRYEDLIDDPEATVRRMCDFVQLDFDPSMLEYTERAPSLVHALPDAVAHQGLMMKPTKGLRDWRVAMTKPDLALFESLAGPTLRSSGYPLVYPSTSATTRVRATAQRASWRFDRTRQTVRRNLALLRRGHRD